MVKMINKLKIWLYQFFKFVLYAAIYPLFYQICSKLSVQKNRIIFLEPSQDKLSNNFQLLYDALQPENQFDSETILLKCHAGPRIQYIRRSLNLIHKAASAKYIFVDEACDVLGRVHFHKETKIIQVWHACGAFKKFGFSTAEKKFNPSYREMMRYPYYNYCDMVTVSSPEVINIYSEAMGINSDKIYSLGISRTDVFFDPLFISKARNKLMALIPSATGKKIILYAPTFRGDAADASSSSQLSLPAFFDHFSDNYILLFKHHPHVKRVPVIPKQYQNFAFDLTNIMDIQELLCAADICISDYSSLIFEFALLDRPMLFFAYDKNEYVNWRGFYYKYEDFVPGPVFTTNEGMIDFISHIDERFDSKRVAEFKKKYMCSCDGHSTSRIINTVLSL